MTFQTPIHTRPSFKRLAASLALAALAALPAHALVFSFSGEITSFSDGAGLLPAEIAVGTTFFGTVSYDPSQAGVDTVAGASYGQYFFTNPDGSDFSLSITIGGHVWNSQPAPLFNRNSVGTGNDLSSDLVTYGSQSLLRDGVSLPGGLGDESLTLSFGDPSGTALNSDALPTLVPFLTIFNNAQLNFIAEDNAAHHVNFTGIINAVPAVPEPGEWAAVASIALAGFALARRRWL